VGVAPRMELVRDPAIRHRAWVARTTWSERAVAVSAAALRVRAWRMADAGYGGHARRLETAAELMEVVSHGAPPLADWDLLRPANWHLTSEADRERLQRLAAWVVDRLGYPHLAAQVSELIASWE